MGGERIVRSQKIDEGSRSAPWVSVEQFREQFSEEMREELYEGLQALYRERVQEEVPKHGDLNDAKYAAHLRGAIGRRALQLIAGLQPPLFT